MVRSHEPIAWPGTTFWVTSEGTVVLPCPLVPREGIVPLVVYDIVERGDSPDLSEDH
jgi:hypothetical protein